MIYYSDDGSSWSSAAPGAGYGGSLAAVAFGDGLFVAVGANGEMQTSTDGETWQHVALSSTEYLNKVGYGAGIWLVLASGADAFLASRGGSAWMEAPKDHADMGPVAYGKCWAGGGTNGKMFTALQYLSSVL